MQLQVLNNTYTLQFTGADFLLLEDKGVYYRLTKTFITPSEPRYTLVVDNSNIVIGENITPYQMNVI